MRGLVHIVLPAGALLAFACGGGGGGSTTGDDGSGGSGGSDTTSSGPTSNTSDGSGGSSSGGSSSGGSSSGGSSSGGSSTDGTTTDGSGGSSTSDTSGSSTSDSSSTTGAETSSTTGTPAPTCEDEIKNGIETDVDCGGPCDPCSDGLGCFLAIDCVSGVCGHMSEWTGAAGAAGATGEGGAAGAPEGPTVCLPPSCHDSVHNGQETDVDCGNGCEGCADGAMCVEGSDCASLICGDDELCDVPVCGDEVTNGSDGCDDGAVDTATCNADCTNAECGDGYHNSVAGEVCDDGGDSPDCNADCTLSECGDSYVNPEDAEECDDGGIDPGDGCDATCQWEFEEFSYVDTPDTTDDIDDADLFDFFTPLAATVDEDWFIYLGVVGEGAVAGAWCSERADWYVDNYLANATGSAVVPSGDWNKYVRPEGGVWSEAITTSFNNHFGSSCGQASYNWCSEWEVTDGTTELMLAYIPNWVGYPQHEMYASTGSGGQNWVFTLRLGQSRMGTCGF